MNITYPSGPERLEGIICPFGDCRKEHALDDCSIDVSLNKALHYLRDNVHRGRQEAVKLGTSARVTTDLSSQSGSIGLSGGKLVAIWSLAEDGKLEFAAEVTNDNVKSISSKDFASLEVEALHKLQEEARTDMDCQVCYGLFCDPLTTACGHTFCRSCLQRILDHSRYCPVCRRKLAMNPLLNRTLCPSNERLSRIIETFWIDQLKARKEIVAADQTDHNHDHDIPLFVCTMSFPMMPTFLHVFEPRYRLMIRRALDGDKTFGMVLPKKAQHDGDAQFHEVGTLLRITDIHYYSDGRSLVETVGVSRFRVTSHGELDGYAVGKIERVDDISLEDEEASEASEALPAAAQEEEEPMGGPERKSRESVTVGDLETMSTRRLMEFAHGFVERMRARGVPWMTERMIDIYGECPTDPALLPWWLANMLPVRDSEKYRLLKTSSVRDRLKICGSWIIEWETSIWLVPPPPYSHPLFPYLTLSHQSLPSLPETV